MILGIGTDLAEVDRIRQSIERFGPRFLDRIFTDVSVFMPQARPTRPSALPHGLPQRKRE